MTKRVILALQIDSGNECFQDGYAAMETSRILSQLANRLRLGEIEDTANIVLRDVDGNVVGHVTYSEGEQT
jgi:predicted N-acetyltransferase YhbS